MMSPETLKKLFKDKPVHSTMTFEGKCLSCGKKVKIDITRTSPGFGFEGGMLFRNAFGGYFAKCIECFNGKPVRNAHQQTKYKSIRGKYHA